MFPVSEDMFFVKIPGFRATTAIKQQRGSTIMVNLKMVCSYRSSCIDLHVELVDCQMKGVELSLHHIC